MANSVATTSLVDVRSIYEFVNALAAGARSRWTRAQDHFSPPLNLGLSDARAIRTLDLANPVTINAAAALMQVEPPRASRQLACLERCGVIVRSADPTDARRSLVRTSDLGREVLLRWRVVSAPELLAPLATWTHTELHTFAAGSERLYRDLAGDLGAAAETTFPPGYQFLNEKDTDRNDAYERVAPALVQFAEWVGATRQFRPVISRIGSPIAMRAMLALRIIDENGPISLSHLSDLSSLDASRTSKYIKELEEHGLILRAVDTLDRRSSRVRSTRKGGRLIRKLDEALEETILTSVAGWNHDDLSQVQSLLQRYIGALQAHAGS